MEEKKTSGHISGKVTIICTILLTFSVTYFLVNMYYYKKYRDFALLSEIRSYVNTYFYGDEFDERSMAESAFEGYVAGLEDAYSGYRGPVEAEENNDRFAGLKTGIGVGITVNEEGYLYVSEVYEGSTAKQAGVLEGDVIVSIDGQNTAELGINGSIEYIGSGEQDSVIVLGIVRDGSSISLDVKRGKIDIISVKGAIVEDGIGYISISRFNEKTPEQFHREISELTEQGAQRFVFDVRNNGGGLVSAVEKCIDPYMPEGEIAQAIYKNGDSRPIVESDAENRDIKAVILINENSASGAELFSAAFRDFKEIPLVGVTSFGKGIMQNTFTLSDGGSLTLTVARYKTTRSECYHGTGLKPDYEVSYLEDSDTDEQFEKALEVLKSLN